MAEIVSIPAEFDVIQVEKRGVPRPPLGPFTHHAVQTFAKTCREGRIGLNWRDHLVDARETWKTLSPEELSTLRQAADEDKQRYDERVALAGRTGFEELLHLLEEKKLQENGFAPSAFDLFKNSHEVRSCLYEAKQGPVDHHEFYKDKVFIWLWDRIDDEEKSHWRQEAQRRLDIRNICCRMKGEEELTLETEAQPPDEARSPGKRKRLARRLGPKTRPPEDDEVVISTNDDEKQQSEKKNTEVGPVIADGLQGRPTKDVNVTTNEKQLLESIPPNLRRWDRLPRAARSSYTLYYADRLAAAGSPHLGEDPHCSSTRAKIHAAWEAAEDETRQHFENLAKSDEQEFDRQSKERNEWQKTWRDLEHRMLLRKVIDRWHPHSSFDDGQNRLRAAIPPHRRQTTVTAVDYGLPCLHYPVIRTDYSNAAVYEHLQHVLLNSFFLGTPVSIGIEITFYDGLQPPLPSTSVEDWEHMPSFAEEDRRANDYEWCRTNLENKSLDDLKAAFGELSFHRKEHIPIYTFGGHGYAIVIDSQSMKDGTVMFVSLSSDDVLDFVGNPGRDGAWEQDPKMEWYLSPRVLAADVVIQLVNLHIAKMNWEDVVTHGVDYGLDVLSDPKAQQWRGWRWAIEYVFGGQALENVVRVIETNLGRRIFRMRMKSKASTVN